MEFRRQATGISTLQSAYSADEGVPHDVDRIFLLLLCLVGILPLMPVVRDEFQLTKSQIGWCLIAATASTIFARLLIGWLCDRIGPRLAYTWLLAWGRWA